MIPLTHYLIVGALLFCIGLAIAITKKNIIVVLMGIELIFNAANVNLVAFSRYDPSLLQGQLYSLFVIVVAAAEAVVALSIVIQLFKYFKTVELNKISHLGDK
ncbi:NADH-quinone oxidoreductase subunit NuoK [Limibacter armeniacum]|uniref:NADH-quinone oxidoreductase subunit NuoK n=1 Tax=Limibacter armeniacum TaxID=466084 RepID=UPI002FE60F11